MTKNTLFFACPFIWSFRNKAKAIKGFCTDLLKRYNGQVPANLDDLVSLSGIGRKTANLVLGEAFGIPGIVVDTHFLHRPTHRPPFAKLDAGAYL